MNSETIIILLSISLLVICTACIYLLYLLRKYRKGAIELSEAATEKETGLSYKKNIYAYDFQKSIELSLPRYNLHPWIYMLPTDKLDILNRENTPFANAFTFTQFLEQAVQADEIPIYIDKLNRFLEEAKVNDHALFEVSPTMIDGIEVFEKLDVAGVAIEKDKDGNVTKMAGIAQLLETDPEKAVKLREIKEMLELSLRTSGIIPWEINFEKKQIHAPGGFPLSPDCTMLVEDFAKLCIEKKYQQLFLNEYERVSERKQDEFDIRIRAFVSATNTVEWVHINGKTVITENNKRMLTGTFQVITQEVNREKELIALRKAAEESNRLKTAFLANMSHEIRTPLNAIVGFSQLLAITTDEKEIAEYNEIIAINNDLLLKLINDILDIAKIEAEQMDYVFSEVNLEEVFQQIYQMYQERMPKGVTLIKETDPSSPVTLVTEKSRMLQVIANFLNNAIKFTSSGSITLGYSCVENYARIYVRDTGKGISPSDLNKVFERFVKLDSFTQGTGLGLSISQVIAERLGGKIGVNSRLEEGSEFWFTLPLEKEE